MSRWQSESRLLTRYLGSGMLNTVAGFAVIFTLMAMGASPLVANICGYAVGFILGFVVSKKFVFHSNGHLVHESVRYLTAFTLCFLFNIWVLQLALHQLHSPALFAQLLAACAYTSSMYLLTRYFVFQGKK